ncbi:hypothetical protein NBRC116584_02220 [Hydrogenophaga sp. 5NK40-0174]
MGGLSGIRRCAQNLVNDGVRRAVHYDQQDKLCMDGQRLELVTGTYGAAGSEYRLQSDSFSRIVANGAAAGSAANGPESFTVQTKNGLTLQYGSSSDSRMELPGVAVVHTWALKQVQDVKGNALSYSYSEDNAKGAWRIASASYAGNSVEFSYEDRPDAPVLYRQGYKFETPLRLKEIVTKVGANVLHRLKVSYSDESNVRGSLVSSLQQCDSSNVCLTPTQFEWTDRGTRSFSNGYWNAHGGGANSNLVMDMNGDGRSDLVGYRGGNDWDVCLSTGSAFKRCQIQSGPAGAPQVIGDINGDGKTDAAYYSGDGSSNWQVCYSDGIGWNCGSKAVGYSVWDDKTVSGDFDGDGRTDMMSHKGDGKWHVCLSRGSSFSCSQWTGHKGGAKYNISGDFNGDGLADIAAYNSTQDKWNVCVSTGSNFSCSFMAATHGQAKYNTSGDFNGDGLSDIAGYNSGQDKWNVCFSTGKGFTCEFQSATNKPVAENKTGDFNGDGLTDLATHTSGTSWNICLADGTRFWCSTWVANGDFDNAFVGDYNGDGIDDMASFASGTNWRVAVSDTDHLRRVKRFVQGQNTTELLYLSLSGVYADNFYYKGSSEVYPRADLQTPLQVVRHVKSSDGVGGMSKSLYSYGGLRFEHASGAGKGLGGLGFRWTKVLNERTGIELYSERSQEWPYVGRVLVEETRKAGAGNAGVLKRATTTLACVQTTGAEQNQPCPASPEPGVTGFIYPSEVVIESWDLNGAAMPVVKASSVLAGTPDQAGGVRQFGDTTSAVVEIYQGGVLKSRKSTSNEYFPSQSTGGQWKLGRLKKATVTSTQY